MSNATAQSAHEQTVIDMVNAFGRGDKEGVRKCLADDLTSYVTNADGSVREVKGSDSYVAIIDAMDPKSANLRLEVPQITTVEPGLVMVMVEVHAERYGKKLHNFSGQLFRFREDVISDMWMVEALPAYSDEFWSTEPEG